jgi:hypothetical protein
VINSSLSNESLRSCAFYTNFPACTQRSSGLPPLEKPYSLPSGGLVQSRALCSLGPCGLAGSPTMKPRKKHLPSLFPCTPFPQSHLTMTLTRNPQGCPFHRSAFPSEKGAGLSDLSHRLSSTTSLDREPAAGYFFTSKAISSYEKLASSLCG